MAAFLLAASLISSSLAGSAAGYQLFPVKGLFYPPATGPNLICDEFREAMSGDGGQHFESVFRQAFPDAAVTINDANKRRTFAVSLQVARASFYSVTKPHGVADIYLPMTASLYFTNVLTGEVLFDTTLTDIPLGSVLEAEVTDPAHARIKSLFAQYFGRLVDELVAKAREQFHPTAISTAVRMAWKGLAILDAGQDKGLAIDDCLDADNGDELRIISVGPSYAVARVELGAFSTGERFARVSNSTLAEIRKPRVLVLVDQTPEGFPPEAMVQLFSDALGASSPVNLTPVNRTFADVLRTVATHAQVSQQELRQREVPDLFVRLSVLQPIMFEAPTEKAYRTRRVTTTFSLATVEDRSGRVLFATRGRDRVEDQIDYGFGLPPASRREIAIKNSLVDLAGRFDQGFRLKTIASVVTQSGDPLEVQDANGVLRPGGAVRIYRDLGHAGGSSDDVLVPVWEAEIEDSTAGRAQAKLSLPFVENAQPPDKGDVVIAEGSDAHPAQEGVVACDGPPLSLGSVLIPGEGAVSLNLFASAFPGAFYSRALSKQVALLINAGCGFKTDLALTEPVTRWCVDPAYRVDVTRLICSGESCAEIAQVAVGFRLYEGSPAGALRLKRGMSTTLTSVPLPPNTPSEVRSAALAADLVEQVVQLAPLAGAQMLDQKQ